MPEHRVAESWFGKNIVQTKCEFCDRFFNAFQVNGHMEREDGVQHFFVCGLCANILGLKKLEEGWYRMGGERGYWWYWTPTAKSKG